MITDLPTSPAELSLLLRHAADWLDELHARRAGTWTQAATVRPTEPDDPPSTVRTEPPADDLTATQANLLAFLHDHPDGFCPDRLAKVVDTITDGRATDSVIQVYSGALGVLLERGLARRHGALVLAKDAPDPGEEIKAGEVAVEKPPVRRDASAPTDDKPRLTAGELSELQRLAKEPQGTCGKGRTRIQNRLVRYGFAEFVDDGGGCAIMEAGRQALELLGFSGGGAST